jgi:hypothetical protein
VRTYEGHKGTDIAPVDPAAARNILAAASGIVVGTRDGTDDRPMRTPEPARDAARCGNGVRIDHGGGWTTQYCHMAKGSVAVVRGQRVARGAVLGRMGASGWAELVHLHFQVERDGTPHDPFARRARNADSGVWADRDASLARTYAPVVVVRAGLTDAVPDAETAKFDGYPASARTDADALVAYVVAIGVPEGTRIATEIRAPDGAVVFEGSKTTERAFAEYFTFSGRNRRQPAWPPVDYVARIEVTGTGPLGEFRLERAAVLRIAASD